MATVAALIFLNILLHGWKFVIKFADADLTLIAENQEKMHLLISGNAGGSAIHGEAIRLAIYIMNAFTRRSFLIF